jgi:hypothetical protein
VLDELVTFEMGSPEPVDAGRSSLGAHLACRFELTFYHDLVRVEVFLGCEGIQVLLTGILLERCFNLVADYHYY